MNKKQFVAELNKRLSAFDSVEISYALAYYCEIIDEKVENGYDEAQAVASVGSVADIARIITSDLTHDDSLSAVSMPSDPSIINAIHQTVGTSNITNVACGCGVDNTANNGVSGYQNNGNSGQGSGINYDASGAVQASNVASDTANNYNGSSAKPAKCKISFVDCCKVAAIAAKMSAKIAGHCAAVLLIFSVVAVALSAMAFGVYLSVFGIAHAVALKFTLIQYVITVSASVAITLLLFLVGMMVLFLARKLYRKIYRGRFGGAL